MAQLLEGWRQLRAGTAILLAPHPEAAGDGGKAQAGTRRSAGAAPAHPPSHQLTHAVLALLLVLPCIVADRIGERAGRCQQLTSLS